MIHSFAIHPGAITVVYFPAGDEAARDNVLKVVARHGISPAIVMPDTYKVEQWPLSQLVEFRDMLTAEIEQRGK